MKVKQLVHLLNQYDQDAEVYAATNELGSAYNKVRNILPACVFVKDMKGSHTIVIEVKSQSREYRELLTPNDRRIYDAEIVKYISTLK